MNSWFELLTDAVPLRAIYGSEIPLLKNIILHSVEIHRDGPSIQLRFDFQEYPKQPPKKWIAAEFNRVQLKLSASCIHSLQIIGMQSECLLNLNVIKESGLIRIYSEESVGMKIDVSAEFLMIDQISAYRDELLA